MKKILILFAVVLIGFASCADSKQSITITVTNPLALERVGEMVEVPMSDVVAKLKLADTAQIVVLDVDGQQVPYQVTYDEKVVFPTMVAANDSVRMALLCKPAESVVSATTFSRSTTQRSRFWNLSMRKN